MKFRVNIIGYELAEDSSMAEERLQDRVTLREDSEVIGVKTTKLGDIELKLPTGTMYEHEVVIGVVTTALTRSDAVTKVRKDYELSDQLNCVIAETIKD